MKAMGFKVRYLVLAALLGVIAMVPGTAYAGNGANFVLYNHHTAKAGEREIMFMNDIGQEADGTRYTAQMIELEYGVTDRWTSEIMFEGQTTNGEGGYNFTGFRWENRYRLFEYGRFLNPVIYTEYEDLGEDTKYAMEIAGREDAAPQTKARERERVLETRIIFGSDISERLDVSFNWINESDLDTGVTSFGYAFGLNYKLPAPPGPSGHAKEGHQEGNRDMLFGLEFFGALGDSDKGITADAHVTQHYVSPNIKFHYGTAMIKLGWTVGITNVSQDIVRLAVGYDF